MCVLRSIHIDGTIIIRAMIGFPVSPLAARFGAAHKTRNGWRIADVESLKTDVGVLGIGHHEPACRIHQLQAFLDYRIVDNQLDDRTRQSFALLGAARAALESLRPDHLASDAAYAIRLSHLNERQKSIEGKVKVFRALNATSLETTVRALDTIRSARLLFRQVESCPRINSFRFAVFSGSKEQGSAFGPALSECTTLASLEYLQDQLLGGAECRYGRRQPTTVNSIMGDVMAFVRYCHDHEWIAKGPPLKDLDEYEVSKGRAITEVEFQQMLDCVPRVVGDAPAASWRFLLRGLWESGFRIADVMNFYWDDVTRIHPRWPGQ